MGLLTDRWSGTGLGSAGLALALLAAGCHTTTKTSLFTAAGPGWHVREGQALWRPAAGMAELGGEVVVAAHDDGRCSVEFSKTPLPLALAQVTRTNWLIHFPPRHSGYSGPRPAPARFAWLYLGDALAGVSLPAGYTFERRPDGSWRLANLRSGETVEGYLAP